MNLLFLEPTEEELAEIFCKICSARLLLDNYQSHKSRGFIVDQFAFRYVARYSKQYLDVIKKDVNSIWVKAESIADDASDRLTPEAIEAVINRHVLWAPQTGMLIAHVVRIASNNLELSVPHMYVESGICKLYGAVAKSIRLSAAQNA